MVNRNGVFVLYMIDWLENHLIPCFFKSNFGVECPGCGIQRAFIALLRGHIRESIHYHPALIPILITLVVLLLQLKFKHPQGGIFVMWLFIITAVITGLNFFLKYFL